jgi:hypothetical protein
MRGEQFTILVAVCALLHGCSRKEEGAAGGSVAPAATLASVRNEPQAGPVGFVDGDGRPIREARIAHLSREAFDDKGRLREDAVTTCPERVRVLVEDAAPDAPGFVTVASLTLSLEGPPGHRLTRPFLLIGDREDAAAGAGSAVPASAGGRLEARYRGAPAGSISVGPAAIHEIPVRFIAAGGGLPPVAEIEKAVLLRLAQANAVWEPLGRRFTRGSVVRLDQFSGLFAIRGRAAGADAQGRPSKCGLRIDANEVSVPGVWRNDGAPMTPKATAAALQAKAGKAYSFGIRDGVLVGDREAVLVRVRRGDGTPATVEALAEGQDVAQAVTPLPAQLPDGIEVSATPALLTLEEIALLGSGKSAASDGVDIFIVTGLRALQARPAFKILPEGLPPWSTAGSAIVSWTLVDGIGRFPYGLARILGELMLPCPPAPGDTLFEEPMSEAPGVAARKRVTAATAAKIAERGRGKK